MDLDLELVDMLQDTNITSEDIIHFYNKRDTCNKTKVKHLITAMQENNQELVQLFVDAGNDTGKGKFGDNGAMEIAIKQDNVHLMNIMRKTIRNKRNLVECSISHGAIKCFKSELRKFLENGQHLDPLDLGLRTLLLFRIDIVKYLVDIGMIDFKWKCWERDDQNLLHFVAKRFDYISHTREICTTQNFADTVRYLLAQGIKASKENKGNLNPLWYLLNSNKIRYAEVTEDEKQSIVTVCNMLLDAMKRESGSLLPVSQQNLTLAVSIFFYLHYDSQHPFSIQKQRAIDLVMQLFQMFLQSGVNPHSVLHSGYSLMWEVNRDLVLYRMHKFESAAVVCKLLFIYGQKPDELVPFLFTAISENRVFLKELVLNAVSLMASGVLNRFKTQTCEKFEDKDKVIYKCIRWRKSLEEMCRCVLYANIPHRRMPAHVDNLPLPPPLKSFLIFQ